MASEEDLEEEVEELSSFSISFYFLKPTDKSIAFNVLKSNFEDENTALTTEPQGSYIFHFNPKRKPNFFSILAIKIFDATELTCNTWTLTGSLVEGDELRIEGWKSVLTAGNYDNIPDNIQVVHVNSRGKEVDVTQNYEITIDPGRLVVLKK